MVESLTLSTLGSHIFSKAIIMSYSWWLLGPHKNTYPIDLHSTPEFPTWVCKFDPHSRVSLVFLLFPSEQRSSLIIESLLVLREWLGHKHKIQVCWKNEWMNWIYSITEGLAWMSKLDLEHYRGIRLKQCESSLMLTQGRRKKGDEEPMVKDGEKGKWGSPQV